ncbi:Protein phosphatase 2C family [Phytophthora cactorum]|nr:Protein phosphatase 2C family [Phytophthora cactorum]
MRTRARRDGPQFAVEAANNEQGTAIPVPTAHASRASRASSNVRVDARPRLRPHPRRTATIWRVQSCVYGGYLEKQSSENPKLWKKRWFVMQESKLFYYKSQGDVKEQKPTDDTCCGVISMENIDSVTTAVRLDLLHLVAEELNEAEARTPTCRCYLCLARPLLLLANLRLRPLSHTPIQKDFGVAAFQIRMESRRYVLRAESKDMVKKPTVDQFLLKSIANIVSALSRTQQSMPRVNRSVSFDYQDYMDQFPVATSVDDLYRGRASGGFLASTSFSDESTGGDGSSSSRTSPRRASSPLAFGGFGPRSPLMFAFDPMDDVPEHHTPPVRQSSIAETKEESIDHDGQLHLGGRWEENENTETTTEAPPIIPTASPPVAAGKYVPRYLRNRSAAEPTSPPPFPVDLSPPQEPAPAPTAGRWVPRHQREGFAEMQPIESFSINTRDSFHETFNEDSSSYSTGDDVHGVTSLLGVRSAMEDVCCCIPDLNAHLKDDQPHHQRQSFYALFDGHSGVRAATFSNQRLVSYLTSHEAFMSDTRLAFEECFAQIDREFLQKADEESLDDGTTAAVVLIRGNRLITANIGDCRAVVSIGGQALDIIEEQTPGRPDERERIEKQGGWVKEERELQLSKLHSMDLSDPEIQQRAERVVKWVTIYRVNGELAVSRAIGDIDYKGEALSKYEYWAFPEDTTECFMEIEITPEFDFLILACDGLWDTIKSKEAVKYVADRLNEGYSAKQASQSLANLAIRSGSSDNVSVVIVMLNTEQMSSSIDAFSRQ